ncbi:MAG: enoyl-CoA hydratase/isomerase family protein [Alphaproteobacteria bacterium]|mgnify:CR=1 FL=1|jgi:enoyl-CoA hydratase/carnithine racemase|nr:enoyl-CoA hydratase/isomerase family protein [Alphaproteobacteria bacterium]MDP6565858.1 enoyl-CoA hydratase/isomerase family protein [Alphaproteobacteria bacterium]MDP6814036.1 enoyl-CoA hydratase/isomerase family protein [Alphaproteobacteria bacterium]
MTFDCLDYRAEDGIAEITLNRPPVNALNMDLVRELIAALRQAGDDGAVRAVVVASHSAKVFCAGLDLDIVSGGDGADMRRFLERLYFELHDVQYRLGKPSIAAVRGAARAGGMTVAVSCDMIFAGEGASFGYPEINVGLIPALHFVHLPRVAGRHRAFEWLFTGDSFGAGEARELGLVNRILPDDQVLPAAREMAAKLAEKSPVVMKLGRDAYLRANDLDYRRGIENVAETMCNVVATEDSREGLAAFVEKRPPRWGK